MQHKRYRHTMLAKVDTVRCWTVASSLKHSMGISQADIVLMASMNDGSRTLLGRFDVANTTFLEAVQAVPECAHTG